MDRSEFVALRPGDIIAHELNNITYVVTAFYGEHAVAVRTIEVTHPSEWRMVSKVTGRVQRGEGGI